jgi:hypothetical protein
LPQLPSIKIDTAALAPIGEPRNAIGPESCDPFAKARAIHGNLPRCDRDRRAAHHQSHTAQPPRRQFVRLAIGQPG